MTFLNVRPSLRVSTAMERRTSGAAIAQTLNAKKQMMRFIGAGMPVLASQANALLSLRRHPKITRFTVSGAKPLSTFLLKILERGTVKPYVVP